MRWIATARFDLAFILGPPIAAVLLVLSLPALRTPEVPLWGWIVFIVFIDVAHVWSSLYRTYLDPDEFRRRRPLYLAVPFLAWIAGAILHSFGPVVFWRALAYLAVFHFVRQQYGLVMVYRHRTGERSRTEACIDKIAIYAAMLYPLLFWHSDPSRRFVWFTEGDFLSFPSWTAAAGLLLYTGALLLFSVCQIRRAIAGSPLNWGKIGIVYSTAAIWTVGIVHCNSDFAFTITNVVAHGVPYFALVWLYGNRKWKHDRSWRGWIHRPAAAGGFVGLLLALAYLEEGLWDWGIWREHAAAYGGLLPPIDLPDTLVNLLVPLLALPQATHYLLDAWIWKFDGSNPGLRYYLFLEGPEPERRPQNTEHRPRRTGYGGQSAERNTDASTVSR